VLIAAVVVIRLALLPLSPIPEPGVHDEFSYLLAADTFAHGRLANQSHPMWIFLETFHVLQKPTYASMYPPAQGGFLAVGQLLGNPWFGVLISVALMCGAILWALQGWLPPRWALLGGILAALRIGIASVWVNGYCGGAPAALGGALVIGALPRIVREQRPRHALLLGLGTALLANSRPLEGLIFCVPVFGALALWLYKQGRPKFATTLPRVVAPILLTSALLVAFIGYYNWKVTHDPLLLPEALDSRVYTNYPVFLWQSFKPPLHYLNPQFDAFYDSVREDLPRTLKYSFVVKSHTILIFFLGITFSMPLIFVPKLLKASRYRLLVIQTCVSFLGVLCVAWFSSHYIAPLTATIFILLVQLLRYLRYWEPWGRPFGVFLIRLIVVLSVLRPVVRVERAVEHPAPRWRDDRVHVIATLNNTPGQHLVLVAYRPQHHFNWEWVYNSADIDGSKVVWARIIPGRDLSPLLTYFKDRKVWLEDADADPVTLRPYSGVELKRVLDLGSVAGQQGQNPRVKDQV
jgi:hypothetical protein